MLRWRVYVAGRLGAMAAFRWLEKPDEHESLALCLRAVLAQAGIVREYDELVAALGLGTATVAGEIERPSEWCALGRDLGLGPMAGAYGLQLRPLHPPAAARGLAVSAEFAQHFRDSYAPLIARALASGQVCLAWRGWSGVAELAWGVLVEARDGALFGLAPGGGDRPVRLAGPAHQVYVVERIPVPEQAAPTPRARFALARRQAATFWQQRSARAWGVLVGSAAYDRWIEQSAQLDPHANAHRSFARLTRVLISARRHQAAWLRRTADELGPAARGVAGQWADACERVAERLTAIADEDEVRRLLATSAGLVGYRGVLEECRAIETVLMAELAREA